MSMEKFKNAKIITSCGLEFCHLNPELEYTTQVDNVTIGTSESNRHQGGYSFDFTWRKHLIMRIYDLISDNHNYFTLQSDLDKLTTEELEKMYFESKLKNKNNMTNSETFLY